MKSKKHNWIPPDVVKNPYKAVEPQRQVIEFAPEKLTPVQPKFYEPPPSVRNPYLTASEYQRLTGIVLIGNANFIGDCTDEKICKATKTLKGTPVGDKFEERPDGLYLKSSSGREEAKRLCNFFFQIIGIYVVKKRDGTIEFQIAYELQGNELVSNRCKDGKVLTISKARYDSIVDDILQNFKECYIVTENKYSAKDYLKEYGAIIYKEFIQNDDYHVQYVFEYLGWEVVNDKNVYLSDNKKGTNYECNCGISIPNVPQEKMREVWLTNLKILDVGKKIYNVDGQINYYESGKVILPFWLYLHVSFACKLFLDAGVEVQFLLILVGRTGSLKTTLCKTFAEVFNEGGMLRFESTGVALENYMEKCIDQIMIVDDLFKEDLSMKNKFEVLTRTFGDGVGRAKATGKDYKENIQAKVRGGCIVTAEHSPNAQQSSTLRYVVNEVGKDSINTDVLTEFQTDKKLSKIEHRPNQIQTVFGGWIEFLERHYGELVSWLAMYQQPPINLKFKRHQQIYKVFCAVAQMILQWGFESGAIQEQQRQGIWEIWHTIIAELMLRNQNLAKITEPYQQFLITLHQAIATGAVLIAPNKDEFEKDGIRYFGFLRIDKGDVEYVLNPDKTMSFVRKHLLDTGKELVSDSTTIWKELFEHSLSKGYINKDGNGGTRNRYFKRIKLHDNQAEMLILSKIALETVIEKLLNARD